MQKLIHYFKEGKGRGLRAMLVFSVLIGLLSWGVMSFLLNTLEKNWELKKFINQLPEITIENGEVVSPANTNAIYSLSSGLPVVLFLQTERDYPTNDASDGFYLTRKAFSIVESNQIQQYPLIENSVINAEKMNNLLRAFIVLVPIFISVLYFVVLWLFFLLVTAISAFFAWIFRFQLSKGAMWRSASFATISIMLICIVMGFFGYVTPAISIFGLPAPLATQAILAVLLTMLISFGIRKKK